MTTVNMKDFIENGAAKLSESLTFMQKTDKDHRHEHPRQQCIPPDIQSITHTVRCRAAGKQQAG